MPENKLNKVMDAVNDIIKGKDDIVKKVLAAVIGGGHILMEDIQIGRASSRERVSNNV